MPEERKTKDMAGTPEVTARLPGAPAATPAAATPPSTGAGTSILNFLQTILQPILSRLMTKTVQPDEALLNIPQLQISIATPAKPPDPNFLANAAIGQTGYDQIIIYNETDRLSNKIWVVNAGPGTLYAVASADNTTWSGENGIEPGTARGFINVYEIRVRSPSANTMYWVSEYEPKLQNNTKSIITPISINTIGANTIVAAVPNVKIRVVKLILVCSAAVSITLQSDGNNLTGAMPFAANGGFALDDDVHPLECNTGEAFIITLGAGVQVSGWSQHIVQ